MIGSGAMSGFNIGRTLLDKDSTLGDIKTSDTSNLLMAGSLGRNWYKNAQAVKAIKSQASQAGKEGYSSFEYDGKVINVPGLIQEGKEVKSLKSKIPFFNKTAKEADATATAANTTENKKKMIAAYNETYKGEKDFVPLDEKDLDKIKILNPTLGSSNGE